MKLSFKYSAIQKHSFHCNKYRNLKLVYGNVHFIIKYSQIFRDDGNQYNKKYIGKDTIHPVDHKRRKSKEIRETSCPSTNIWMAYQHH